MARTNEVDMEKVKRYKDMLKRGLITEAKIDKLVEKGVLTEKEKQLILSDINK